METKDPEVQVPSCERTTKAVGAAKRMHALFGDLAFGSAPTMQLGASVSREVIEANAPALRVRGEAFYLKLADLFESRIQGPLHLFNQLMSGARDAFGALNVRYVLASHYYVGSGSGAKGDDLMKDCYYLDFPEPYNIEGPGGMVEKVVQAFPGYLSSYEFAAEKTTSDPVASSLLESREDVSRTLAFPQTESATQ